MKLTADQVSLLAVLAREPGEGWLKTAWVSHELVPPRLAPWITSRLRTLRRRGLVKGTTCYWRITDAGRAALAEAEGRGDG